MTQNLANKGVAPMLEDYAWELQQFIKDHPNQPVILYLSGRHPADATHPDGFDCSACAGFEKAQGQALEKHKNSTAFVQTEMPVGPNSDGRKWQTVADALNATVDWNKGELITADGKHYDYLATPTLLQISLDKDGKLHVDGEITQPSGPTFESQLTKLEKDHALKVAGEKAAVALADKTPLAGTVPYKVVDPAKVDKSPTP